MERKGISLILVFCMILILIPGEVRADEVIKIGVIGPMRTSSGKGMRQAAEMAAEEMNAEGGILGRKVELLFSDTGYKPDMGKFGYTKFAKKDKVAAVLGTASSEVALAVVEQMAQCKVPFLATSATSPKLAEKVIGNYDKYKYFFRVFQNSLELAEFTTDWLVSELAKKRGMKRAALMIENAVWTTAIAEKWEKSFKAAGIEITVFEYFDKKTKDFAPILSKIIETKAEMICVLSSHVEALTYITQWADMKGPIISGIAGGSYSTIWDASDGKVMSLSMLANPGVVGLTPWARPFYERYTEKYKSTIEFTAPSMYDTMYILKAALERAKSTEPDALVKALEETDHKGAMARWVFDKKSHHSMFGPGYRQFLILQWQAEGKLCVVWPEESKTCEFILPPWY